MKMTDLVSGLVGLERFGHLDFDRYVSDFL